MENKLESSTPDVGFNLDGFDIDPIVKRKIGDEIIRLNRELAKASSDCFNAAVYGKNLLDEKQRLTKELDKLNQAKHSLSQKLALKEKVDLNRTTDIDALQDQLYVKDEENKELTVKLKEQDLKIKSLKDQIQESETREEEFKVKLIKAKEYEEELLNQINTLNEREKIYNISLHSTYSQDSDYEIVQIKNDEVTKLYLQSQELLKEKEKEIKTSKLEIQVIRCDLALKEEKISSLSTLLEEYKNEIEHLQLDIECNKAQQVDVNKRGNCIFAEIEDHRALLEKKLATETEKCNKLAVKLSEAREKIEKQSAQIMTLLNLKEHTNDQNRTRELESNLLCAHREISQLQSKLNTVTEELNHAKEKIPITTSSDQLYVTQDSCTDFQLHHLNLLHSKDRELIIQKDKEIKSLTFTLATYKEQLLSVEIKLHNSQAEINCLKAEVTNLRLQLNFIKRKNSDSSREYKEKTKVEKIPITGDSESKRLTSESSSLLYTEITTKPESSRILKNTLNTLSTSPSEKDSHQLMAVIKQETKANGQSGKLPNKSLGNKILQNKDMESLSDCKQQ